MPDYTQTLRCLLLPIRDQTLLLPYAAVAEIIPLIPSIPITSIIPPPWILGVVEWRGVQVPLLCLENMMKEELEMVLSPRAQIAIVNRLYDESKHDFFAILLRDIPHFEKVKEEDLVLAAHTDEPHMLLELVFKGQQVFIPNLPWLEAAVVALDLPAVQVTVQGEKFSFL